jgi:hypothetical protein
MEQTQMVLAAATYLDEETVIKHLPFISVDEQAEIMKRKANEDVARYKAMEEELAEQEQAQQQEQTEPPQGE